MADSSNLNKIISDSIERIALGKNVNRIRDAKVNIGGAGTSKMIRGWVSKVHLDKNDSEYSEYAGKVDVTEYFDEKYTAEPIVYKGVELSGDMSYDIGFVIIPALHSDVTIIVDSGTSGKYIVDYSYANMVQIKSENKTLVGVTETDKLDTISENAPDYNELERTGKETFTEYTVDKIITVIKDKNGNLYSKIIDSEKSYELYDDSSITLDKNGAVIKKKETEINISDNKITIGKTTGTASPTVKGTEYASLMKDFLLECSQLATPTMMGTMPPVNFANFTSLITRLDSTLSNLVFTKE